MGTYYGIKDLKLSVVASSELLVAHQIPHDLVRQFLSGTTSPLANLVGKPYIGITQLSDIRRQYAYHKSRDLVDCLTVLLSYERSSVKSC